MRFEKPVVAPAPGQHLMLHDAGGAVVAGGAILQTYAVGETMSPLQE